MADQVYEVVDGVFADIQNAWSTEAEIDSFRDYLESPIEEALLVALLLKSKEPGREFVVTFHNEPRDSRSTPIVEGVYVWPQTYVLGNFRPDFLAMVTRKNKTRWMVIECDGYEFHDKGKYEAARDKSRDRAMTLAGIRVFRFAGKEIKQDAGKCAAEVFEMLTTLWGELNG